MQALAIHVGGQGIWAHDVLPMDCGWGVGDRNR
jgi:hypothetical protein